MASSNSQPKRTSVSAYEPPGVSAVANAQTPTEGPKLPSDDSHQIKLQTLAPNPPDHGHYSEAVLQGELDVSGFTAELQVIFANGGEMGRRFAAYDWTGHCLGHPNTWNQQLVTSVGIMLASSFPIVMFWGPELVTLYNDGYAIIFGARHPSGFARPSREAWAEIWDVIEPMFRQVMDTGVPTWRCDHLLFKTRNSYVEECYFTWSYSPVRHSNGTVLGIFAPVNETTQRVLQESRMRTLRDLGAKTLEVRTVTDACQVIGNVLDAQPSVPFSLLYLGTSSDKMFSNLRLSAVSGFSRNKPSTPMEEAIDSINAKGGDKLSHLIQSLVEDAGGNTPMIVLDAKQISDLIGPLPGGSYDEQPKKAVLLPFRGAYNRYINGVIVAGVNPRRMLDEQYNSFFELLTAQVGRTLQTAKDYEEEKQRAEMLEELDRAKTVFFSNISHEFRTPLTLMIGPLEDSLNDTQEPLPPAQKQRQTLVYRNSLRLLKHVNALLDYSRIQANRIQAKYESANLSLLTSDLASVFRSLFESAGLKYTIDTPPLEQTYEVFVDKEMYEKIVFNLLSNAFKFTLSGGITVSVRPSVNADGKRIVSVTISDTGSGIPDQDVPQLFQRFHRVAGSQGRSYEGTGIGLALAHELVKLHGASITVESQVGKGTAFTIIFLTGKDHLPPEHIHQKSLPESVESSGYIAGPVATRFIEEASQWVQKDLFSFPGSNPGSNPTSPGPSAQFSAVQSAVGANDMFVPGAIDPKERRILIADDNNDMRGYIASLLRSIAQVECASDGEAAWQLLTARKGKEDQFHLVLSDIMMPRLDGMGLISRIRNNPSTKNIPVILLSARAGDEARVEGLHAGADDYMVKPFSAKELLARVHTHLELFRLRMDLERQVEQRTAQLQAANDALQKEISERVRTVTALNAERARAELNEEFKKKQEHFIDTLCHEIRNPLNGVHGVSAIVTDKLEALLTSLNTPQLAQHTEEAKRCQSQVQDILSDVSTLALCSAQQKVILDDVLDLSKLNNGKVELQISPCLLNEVVSKASRLFSATLQQKHISLEMNLPSPPQWVRIDSHRVSQIIINLLSNAVKFTIQGQVVLEAFFTPFSEVTTPALSPKPLVPVPLSSLSSISPAHSPSLSTPSSPGLSHATTVLISPAPSVAGSQVSTRSIGESQTGRATLSRDRSTPGSERSASSAIPPPTSSSLNDNSISNNSSGRNSSNAGITYPASHRSQSKPAVRGRLEVSVRDTGVGMTPEEVGRLFDKFSQANSRVSSEYGGSGLGLAISKQLVTLMQGEMKVDSQKDRGSMFTFWIPCSESSAEEAAESAESYPNVQSGVFLPQATQLRPFLYERRISILIVEDNTINQKLLMNFLSRKGFSYQVASNGKEAVDAHANHEFDLIFMDIQMPVMDGLQATRCIRERERLSNHRAVIVALTGNAGEARVRQALEAGMDGYLTKPYDRQRLYDLIHHYCHASNEKVVDAQKK